MAILKADSRYVGILSKVLELKLPPSDQCSAGYRKIIRLAYELNRLRIDCGVSRNN
jgi:hypothetical protein